MSTVHTGTGVGEGVPSPTTTPTLTGTQQGPSALDPRGPCVSCGGPLGQNNVNRSCEGCTVARVFGRGGDEGRVTAWQAVCMTCGDVGPVYPYTDPYGDAYHGQHGGAGGDALEHNVTVHNHYGTPVVDSDGWEEA